jgi:hypothetical protein
VAPDLVVLWIASLLCIVAVLCAVVSALLRRRRLLRMCGVSITALSALIVADVLLVPNRPGPSAMVAAQSVHPAATASPQRTAAPAPTGTPVPTPTPTPTPTPPARTPAPTPNVPATQQPTPQPKTTAPPPAPPTANPEVLHDFSTAWADIVHVSVAALKAHDSAGEYLRTENIPAASRELKSCQDRASGIVGRSFNMRLDPQRGADRDFLIAINKVGDGLESVCKSARSYLDTHSPSDFADAKTHFANVVDGIFQAEQHARSKYQSLGGNPDTLLSFKTALR